MRLFLSIVLLIFVSYFTLFSQLSTVVSLTGSIKNELTKEPIAINVVISNMEGKQIVKAKSNSKDGYYFITGLKPDSTYVISFNDMKYFSNSFEYKVPNTNKYQEYSKDFLVTPKSVGMEFPIKVPPFDIGKSKLRPGSELFLNDIISLMKSNMRTEFVIKVFPDNGKDAEFNEQLTNSRAEALRDFFVKNGIRANKLSIEGSNVLDPNNPPPTGKQAKGKRYRGSIYLKISKI